VMNDLDYLLLVQEDKVSVLKINDTAMPSLMNSQRNGSSDNPEPQLIAEIIASFYQNNFRRIRAGLPPLPRKLMPGITMVGTSPFFYRIPVLTQLLDALVTASFPEDETIVTKGPLTSAWSKCQGSRKFCKSANILCDILSSYFGFKIKIFGFRNVVKSVRDNPHRKRYRNDEDTWSRLVLLFFT
jgi:hypothetical protein